MILWATDYDQLKTYSIKLNQGQISESSLELFNELDQKIETAQITIEFKQTESCTATIVYNDNTTQKLILIGIKNG